MPRLDRAAGRGLGERGDVLGRLDDGCVVPLAFVPDARPGAYLLVHLGIPVEVLDPATPERHLPALADPTDREDFDELARTRTSRTPAARALGVALAFTTAVVSGVAVYVNWPRGEALRRRDGLHDGQERGRRRVAAGAGCRRGRTRGDASSNDSARLPRQWLALLAVAVVGGSVPFVLFFEGLARAEATQAAFIHKTLVVWVVMLAVPLLRERVGPPHALAVALLIAGQAWIAARPGRRLRDRRADDPRCDAPLGRGGRLRQAPAVVARAADARRGADGRRNGRARRLGGRVGEARRAGAASSGGSGAGRS